MGKLLFFTTAMLLPTLILNLLKFMLYFNGMRTLLLLIAFGLCGSCFSQLHDYFFVGDWQVTKKTESEPSDRMSSQYSYLVTIDSAGIARYTDMGEFDNMGRSVVVYDSSHVRIKWLYDYYVYRVDSVAENYLECSYLHDFVREEDPFEYELQPMGYDPNEEENPEVNTMLEVFFFRRVLE